MIRGATSRRCRRIRLKSCRFPSNAGHHVFQLPRFMVGHVHASSSRMHRTSKVKGRGIAFVERGSGAEGRASDAAPAMASSRWHFLFTA
jgi:hypothetical protein